MLSHLPACQEFPSELFYGRNTRTRSTSLTRGGNDEIQQICARIERSCVIKLIKNEDKCLLVTVVKPTAINKGNQT